MQELFERAEKDRLNSKRFREQSSNQLGLHLLDVNYTPSIKDKIEDDLDTKKLYPEPSSCQIDGLCVRDKDLYSSSLIESRDQENQRGATEMPKVTFFK
jgi:hypothetical protein